jgi:hypothetical protein
MRGRITLNLLLIKVKVGFCLPIVNGKHGAQLALVLLEVFWAPSSYALIPRSNSYVESRLHAT